MKDKYVRIWKELVNKLYSQCQMSLICVQPFTSFHMLMVRIDMVKHFRNFSLKTYIDNQMNTGSSYFTQTVARLMNYAVVLSWRP
jgi:hypothetical protein